MVKKRHFHLDQNFISGFAALVLGVLLAFYGLIILWPQGNPYESVKVMIPKGASLGVVSTALADKNIISSEPAFLLAVRMLGYEKDIPAGRFNLINAQSNFDIIDQLVHGRQVQKRVTVLEGWTIADIAKELERKLQIDPEDFISLCSNRMLLWKLGIDGDSFEGYLFPNTYYFPEDITPKEIITIMVNQYHASINDQMRARMEELGMTEREVLTLASIIEGEAIYDRERPLISGVYHNRLKKGMKLQADPTIQYIIKDGPRRLLNRDLKIDSPYNTYLYHGLPPGPINNPGLESIKAALYPAETEFLYFVARGDGYHTFSKTQNEHNQAKREFQRFRRKMRRQNLNKS
jgi:UPF0755 protein